MELLISASLYLYQQYRSWFSSPEMRILPWQGLKLLAAAVDMLEMERRPVQAKARQISPEFFLLIRFDNKIHQNVVTIYSDTF
jgi:hypothetical protein